MRVNPGITKRLEKSDERDLMRSLAEKRQQLTPQHKDPAWMAAYYKRLAS